MKKKNCGRIIWTDINEIIDNNELIIMTIMKRTVKQLKEEKDVRLS